jgi:hypothetical protein
MVATLPSTSYRSRVSAYYPSIVLKLSDTCVSNTYNKDWPRADASVLYLGHWMSCVPHSYVGELGARTFKKVLVRVRREGAQ